MNETVFPVDIDSLSEVAAPSEALSVLADPTATRSRAIYALPAASFLTAGCDLDLGASSTLPTALQPPLVKLIEDPSLDNPLSSPSVDVIINPASNTPPSVTDVTSNPSQVDPVTPPSVEVVTPTPTPSLTDITSNQLPGAPITPPAVEVVTPTPTPTIPVPAQAVDLTGTSSVIAPLFPAAGGLIETSGPSDTSSLPTLQAAKPATNAEAAQFILKASLSVTEAEISDIRSAGYAAWLNKQMDMPIAQTGVAWMSSRGFDKITIEEYYHFPVYGDYMVWNQMMTSPDAVRKRVAFALSQFFVVSTTDLMIYWRSNAVAHFWDQLNSNAFGNFRKLLEDVTLNPAMGVYLSTLGNRKEDPATGRVPDENFAREIMQLFTIGLYQLNIDGTRKTDANGNFIETYTNNDVSNLARVFTGYHYDFTGNVRKPSVRFPASGVNSVDYVYKPMTSDPTKWEKPQATSEHSLLEKSFIGTTIPANTNAPASLKIALDALFNHPNVGPFFAQQMIQRFVTSNPSPAYVERVAKAFNNNGSGVRGDLRAVFKAILLDSEAIKPSNATAPTAGKLREPVLRLTQWGRTFGAASKSGNWGIPVLMNQADSLAQSPLRSPSVFNFFRPGYVPANTSIAANGLVAPEFQLVNEVTIAGYVNFLVSAIKGEMNNTGWDVGASYANELAIAHNSAALLDRLCLLLAANQISESTKLTIKTALDASTVLETSPQSVKQKRVSLAILLVMASPDYLVQK